jgi:hypothetical protein
MHTRLTVPEGNVTPSYREGYESPCRAALGAPGTPAPTVNAWSPTFGLHICLLDFLASFASKRFPTNSSLIGEMISAVPGPS